MGDVRSYPLLEAFHASVQLQQAPVSLKKSALRQRIAQQMNEEAQLTVDPAFFVAQQHLPQISHVQIQLRRGHFHNEMTRFRYDVILHVGKQSAATPTPRWVDWQKDEMTLPALRKLLEESQPEVLGIRQIPNVRLSATAHLLDLLASDDGPTTAGELRDRLAQAEAEGVEPEAFWALSDQLPYTIYVNWSGNDATRYYDVICQRVEAHADTVSSIFAHTLSGALNSRQKPWAMYANNPGKRLLTRQLEPQLRSYLGERLPEYMLPHHFVLLDTLPLTPSGKIDRRALPVPTTRRPDLLTELVIPQTSVEQQLAAIWQAVLKLEGIGLHDNFFELGGHSLMAMQVASRIRSVFQTPLPVRALFEYRTIATLAKHIEALVAAQQMTMQAKQVMSTQGVQKTKLEVEERVSEEW